MPIGNTVISQFARTRRLTMDCIDPRLLHKSQDPELGAFETDTTCLNAYCSKVKKRYCEEPQRYLQFVLLFHPSDEWKALSEDEMLSRVKAVLHDAPDLVKEFRWFGF